MRHLFVIAAGMLSLPISAPGQDATPPPAEPKPAAPAPQTAAAPAAIDATNLEELRKRIGQNVIVKGVVDRLEITASSQNGRLFFKGAEKSACIYFRKAVRDNNPGWKPGELAGKVVFASGKLTTYNNILTVTITSPQHIADAPENLAAAGAPAPSAPAPVETGPPVKRMEAAVTQILLSWPKGQPKLDVDQHKASWKKKASDKSPLLVVGKLSKPPAPSLLGLDLIKSKYGDVPGGKTLTVQPSGAGIPSALTTALLVEATLQDFALPQNLVSLGDLAPNGAFDKGADTLLYLTESTVPAGSVILAPAAAETMLLDLALEGAWKILCSSQVIGAERLDAAFNAIRQLSDPEISRQMERFAQLQAQVAKGGAPVLKQPAAKTFLTAFLKVCPHHLTAKTFLTVNSGKVPQQYSPDGARLRLRQFLARTLEEFKTLPSDRGDRRKKLKEITDAYKPLRQKCPPSLKPTPESVDEFLEAAEEKFRLDESDKSERAKSALKKAEDAYDKAYELMRQDFDVGERKKP